MAGQIIKRGDSYTVRIFLGRDPETGTRRYLNRTVRGPKKDAQKLLTQLLREKDLGQIVQDTNTTLNQHLNTWLEVSVKPRVKETTYRDYERLMRLYVREPLGGRKLTQLSAVEIQAVYAGMQARGLSARTVRYTHTALKNALGQAVRWRLLHHNPAQYVDLPRKEHQEARALSREEVDRFLAASKGRRWHSFFLLLLGTGLRPSEALALRWTDIDWPRASLHVTRTLTRSGKGWAFDEPKTARGKRNVQLPQGLLSVMVAHQEDQSRSEVNNPLGMVFVGETGQPAFERNILRRHFRPTLQASGLPKSTRIYDLRHTHATLLLLEGVHPKVVSERLGHASIALTLDTYSHVLPSMQREGADKLNSLLFGSEIETDPFPQSLN